MSCKNHFRGTWKNSATDFTFHDQGVWEEWDSDRIILLKSNFNKKSFQHRCFPVKFEKFFEENPRTATSVVKNIDMLRSIS